MTTEEKKKYDAKIYKIVCSCCDKIYVGSTRQRLSKRFHDHKKRSKILTRKSKLYTHMRLVGCDKFDIIQLESVKVSDRDELFAIENKYIRELNVMKHGFNQQMAIREEIDKNKYHKNMKDLNVSSKRFYCIICDFSGRDTQKLRNHLNTKRHYEKLMDELPASDLYL